MDQLTKALPQKSRIEFLDILRGIAILYIFLANIPSFNGLVFMSPEQLTQLPYPEVDNTIRTIMSLFVDGKFYSIFSILFGIGLVIQQKNLENKGVDFNSFFARRMFGLVIIGFIHLYIWFGDILNVYALLGFLLIPLRNLSNKKLLIWACILTFIPVLHYGVMLLADLYYPYAIFMFADSLLIAQGYETVSVQIPGIPEPLDIIDMASVLANSSFADLLSANISNPFYRWGSILLEGRLFKILACFLLGIWAGRQILDNDLLNNMKFLKMITLLGMSWGLTFGIIFKYTTWFEGLMHGDIIFALGYALSVIPMAIGNIGLIVLLWKSGFKPFNLFKPIGRMALTNYMMQSILSIAFFYGVGLGYITKLSLWESHIFVVVVFGLQIVFSTLWLKYFRFGPLEWIWRMFTYKKVLPIRK